MSGGLSITLDAHDLARLGNLIAAAGHKAPLAIARAINHSGDKAKTKMTRALTAQTGLKRKTIVKALKVKKAGAGGLTYAITSRGGDVSLKYFSPRETAKGVSAAPWNRRSIYAHSFMKAGWWPHRVVKPNWNGHAFYRLSSKTDTHHPSMGKGGMDRFDRAKSHLFIPDEMVKGATADAFYSSVDQDLAARLAHELLRAIGG